MKRRHRVFLGRWRTSATLATTAILALVSGLVAAPTANAQNPVRETDPAPIAKAVQERLDEKGTAEYWLVFSAKADLSEASAKQDWTARGQAVVDRLKETATKSQAKAKQLLKDSDATSTAFWASNRILVQGAGTALTDKLAALPGVEKLAARQTLKYDPPKQNKPRSQTDAVEWGVAAIQADQVWSDFGVRGAGITVANIDTGVQYDHPALVGAYRGNTGGTFDHNYNFFDPSSVCGGAAAAPCDPGAHGSHTMGTMIGDDGAGNQIGVAPEANWISAIGCDQGTGCSDFALLSSGQWMLEPLDRNGQNPRVDLRPNVVNNSWGAGNGSVEDPFYDDIVAAWNASGIFSSFSNGNEGPGCDTAGSPADGATAYGVGAFDSGGAIAYFSSRGPGADDDIRPHVSAPGVNVRSSVPDDGYASFDGTSMAAPHLAGTVALMWSAAPALMGDLDATKALLDDSAVDVDDTTCGGTADDNNVWGEGKLDALGAVTSAPRGDTGTLTGTVTDATSGAPVAGARLSLQGPLNRQIQTNAEGQYRIVLSSGTYAVQASAFGYVQAEADIEVVTDETATQDFALEAAESYRVLGEVTNAAGDPIAGADVTVEGTPLGVQVAAADGSYEFASVPAGTYTITASADGCVLSRSREVVVDARKIVNFRLSARTDTFGYRCASESASYVQGNNRLDLSGDDSSAPVDLPFPVWLYGERYEQVNVSTNGFVDFTAPAYNYVNVEIPNPTVPNSAIYAFWDDLFVPGNGGVFTRVTGTAPNRTFIIEWRRAQLLGDDSTSFDFEMKLREKGQVVMAYRNVDPAHVGERGGSATVGIENANGTDALQYSLNKSVLADGKAIKFRLPSNGFLTGTVYDENDDLPIGGAEVSVADGDEAVLRTTTTKADGTYATQVGTGDHTVTTSAENYQPESADVTIANGEMSNQDFTLATARAEVDADPLSWVLPEGVRQQKTITLSNTGSAQLRWATLESGGHAVTGVNAEPSAKLVSESKRERPNAKTAAANFTKAEKAKAVPEAKGDVLTSWPTGMAPAWGVGFTGSVWISDPFAPVNKEFTVGGVAPGTQWTPDWAGDWAGDMAQDTRTGNVCQVNVGGDNGIYCWDPDTGEVAYTITGSPWGNISQRGLAYSADDDTFYIAGWNEDIVYHVAGASHDNPGETLGSCSLAGSSVSGLAYNPTANALWVTTNSPTDTILRIDPDTCGVAEELGFPDPGGYLGAGAELDRNGNLWVTSQGTSRAYLLETGLPITTDVPWLSEQPAEGELATGEQTDITVEVDTTGMEAGVYHASVMLDTNSGRQPMVEVPVEVVVSGYWKGIDAASSSSYADRQGLPWYADTEYDSVAPFGWIGESTERSVPDGVDIRGTEDDALYRTQRQAMDAYRFDDLPGGTYEVTLDFAELARSPRVDWRMFDVDINGQYVLVGYDIADRVGGRMADRHTFTTDVPDDGNITVNFHDRRSYQPSVVNAIRVVHRPDLS